VGVETRAENHFKVLVEDLEQKVTAKTKGILLGYPSNPTGATMSHSDMADIVNFARKHGLYILSDEIYDRLSYDSPHVCVPSVAGAYERTILFNGFSKAYAMTGWRIGFVCAPENIIAAMTKLHSYTMLCAPITGQKAALEALKSAESEVVEMVRQYNQRRHLIVDGLNAIGLKCHMPEGAFYAFPSIKNTGLTSEQFAERLLFEEKVALVPGTAFGASGEGHVRCSYATATDKIEMALMRMKRFVDKLAVKV
jgi:aminotransferase